MISVLYRRNLGMFERDQRCEAGPLRQIAMKMLDAHHRAALLPADENNIEINPAAVVDQDDFRRG